MALIVDIILIAILALAIWTGYRRGIVKTVVKFVLLLLSVLLAIGFALIPGKVVRAAAAVGDHVLPLPRALLGRYQRVSEVHQLHGEAVCP